MSAKQLRRYLEVTGQVLSEEEKIRAILTLHSSDEDDDDGDEEGGKISNRFAVLGEDDDEDGGGGGGDSSSDNNSDNNDSDKDNEYKKDTSGKECGEEDKHQQQSVNGATTEQQQQQKDSQKEENTDKETKKRHNNKSSNKKKRKKKQKKTSKEKEKDKDKEEEEEENFDEIIATALSGTLADNSNNKKSSSATNSPTGEKNQQQQQQQKIVEQKSPLFVLDDPLFESEIFKVDGRLYNYENEFRRLVGEKPLPSTSRDHRRDPVGRIVKRKLDWPEIRNVGISMVLDCTEGEHIKWFKFTHNSHYKQLQYQYWDAVDSTDQSAIAAILQECPYHLDTLMVMAEIMRNQDENRASRDFIERGILCCEHAFDAQYCLNNSNHRIAYMHFENRAFFLLLHRHMRTLIERSLVETAFHIAKLLYRLDPLTDPLGILLIIDSIAIKADQPRALIQIFDLMESSRRIDRLPNFAFSLALAHYQLSAAGEEDRSIADEHLASAIRHFPTMVLQILDKLNVQPDSALENHKKMNRLAHLRESEGIQLLTKIYIAHTHNLWRKNTVLRWLEQITASTMATFDNYILEMNEWQNSRNTLYIGIPQNVHRHAILWDLEPNTESIFTDPAPPYISHSSYVRVPAHREERQSLSGSFLLDLLQTLIPDNDQAERIREMLGDLVDTARDFIHRNDGGGEEEQQQQQNRLPDEEHRQP